MEVGNNIYKCTNCEEYRDIKPEIHNYTPFFYCKECCYNIICCDYCHDDDDDIDFICDFCKSVNELTINERNIEFKKMQIKNAEKEKEYYLKCLDGRIKHIEHLNNELQKLVEKNK